jgi:hypothetical protein
MEDHRAKERVTEYIWGWKKARKTKEEVTG